MIRFGYADTPLGQLHYAERGSGPPVVLLHQTPRSWDEFREVLPVLGDGRRAIAPDTPGFGASAPVAEHTIENYAAGVLYLLTRIVRDALRVWPDVEHGHAAVSAYRMEERIDLIDCPVLCAGAAGDPYAFPELGPLTGQIPHAETAVIEGGAVPLEFQAEEFARLVADFLDRR